MEIVWKLEFGIWFGRNLAEQIRRSTAGLSDNKTPWRKKECGFSGPLRNIFTSVFNIQIKYRAGRPICRKVLKITFWEVPLADWLIL